MGVGRTDDREREYYLPDAGNLTEAVLRPSPLAPRIAGVGTAVAGEPYSQRDLLEIFHWFSYPGA
jgi:hypothetical protein